MAAIKQFRDVANFKSGKYIKIGEWVELADIVGGGPAVQNGKRGLLIKLKSRPGQPKFFTSNDAEEVKKVLTKHGKGD